MAGTGAEWLGREWPESDDAPAFVAQLVIIYVVTWMPLVLASIGMPVTSAILAKTNGAARTTAPLRRPLAWATASFRSQNTFQKVVNGISIVRVQLVESGLGYCQSVQNSGRKRRKVEVYSPRDYGDLLVL
jgi:hypothetical protein